MAKSTAKQSEEAVADAFEAAGFETYIPPKAKFRQQDIHELFDIEAVDLSGGRLWWIQVKTNTVRSITDWFASAETYQNGLRDARVAYAIVHTDEDPDAVRLAVSAPEGYTWAVDERGEAMDTGEGVVEFLRGGERER